MDIPGSIKVSIQELLNSEIIKFTPTSGGCINRGGELITKSGRFFIKWNSAEKFPGMFKAEDSGLTILASKKAIHIPEVIHYGRLKGSSTC